MNLSLDHRADPPSKRDAGVQCLRRGLSLLTEVSASGGLRPAELSRRLGLPRPTVYRLLETLEEEGFVSRSSSDGRFRVTLRASSLGAGYSGSVALSNVAGPVLTALGRQLVWPVDLVTCQAGSMVVQETTHARSPLSLDHGMIGKRLPLLRTASGRAYLAYCSLEERVALLDYLCRIDDPADRPFLSNGTVDALIKDVRAAGCAKRSNTGAPIPGTSASRTCSIGVPVLSGDVLQGCLAVIWLAEAVGFPEANARFLPAMHQAAAVIGERLAADWPGQVKGPHRALQEPDGALSASRTGSPRPLSRPERQA